MMRTSQVDALGILDHRAVVRREIRLALAPVDEQHVDVLVLGRRELDVRGEGGAAQPDDTGLPHRLDDLRARGPSSRGPPAAAAPAAEWGSTAIRTAVSKVPSGCGNQPDLRRPDRPPTRGPERTRTRRPPPPCPRARPGHPRLHDHLRWASPRAGAAAARSSGNGMRERHPPHREVGGQLLVLGRVDAVSEAASDGLFNGSDQLNRSARLIHLSRFFSFGLSGVPGWMIFTGQRSAAAITISRKVPAVGSSDVRPASSRCRRTASGSG